MKVLAVVLTIVASVAARELQAVAQLFQTNERGKLYTGSIIFNQPGRNENVRILGRGTTLPSGQYALVIQDKNGHMHDCYSSSLEDESITEILGRSSGNYRLSGYMNVTRGRYAIDYETSHLTLQPDQKCSIVGLSVELYRIRKFHSTQLIFHEADRIAHGYVELRFRILLYFNAAPINYNVGTVIFTENHLTGDVAVSVFFTDLVPGKYILAVHKVRDSTHDCNSLGSIIKNKVFRFSYSNFERGYGTHYFEHRVERSSLDRGDAISIAGHAIALYESSTFQLIGEKSANPILACALV